MSDYLLSNFRKLTTQDHEVLRNINLSDTDVLTRAEDQRVRLTNLSKAMALSKSKNLKTYLTIKDASANLYKFQLNITGFNTQVAYTQDGFHIPLKCILSVDFLA